MNRENKRKQYQKGYFKQNPCNDVFTCKECGRLVLPEFAGTNHRNHCPNCLTSLHIDNQPGDRLSNCGGHMEPIGVWIRKNGEWALIHRCKRCGNPTVVRKFKGVLVLSPFKHYQSAVFIDVVRKTCF